MPRPTSRQLCAALAALVVVCSIGGTPVAATVGDSSLTDDGLPTDLNTGDGETDRSSDSGAETGDRSDGDGDDGTDADEADRDGDDESEGDEADRDGDDESEGDEGADDGGAESSDDGDADDDEAEDSSEERDDRRYSEFYTRDNGERDDESDERERESNEGGDDEGDDRARLGLTELEALDADSDEDTSYVGEVSTDVAETPGDDLGETTRDTAETAAETVDTKSLTISIGFLDLELATYSGATHTDAVPTSGGTELGSTEDTSELELSEGDGDRVADGEATAVAGAGDGDGDGGPEPQPSDGAVVALGALAAIAAVRSSPFVAASGANAASATGSSLLSPLLERVRPFVFPLRYSRYDDSDPLEHEAREQVFEIVNEEPGSYLSEVSEEADLPLSTTRHHIKVLEREDLVSGAKLRGKRRFYPAYAEGIELAAALNDDSTANIIDAIARIGATSVSDLADELERDPSTISHHLQRLEEDDIVTREREGRAVVTRLSTEARTALEPESTPRPGEAGEVLAGGAD